LKRKKQVGGENSQGALLQLMTISLFIILLAFFILLNSIAVVSEKKIHAALGSLLSSFGGPTGGYSVIEGMGEKMDGLLLKTESGYLDLSSLLIENEELRQNIRVRPDKRGSRIQISSKALFGPGETVLNPAGKRLLERLAELLGSVDYPVEIYGYTDNMPAESPQTFTKRELSALWAIGVMRFLIEKQKFSSKRLTACGWGETHPAYSNKTADARELNRRVELLLVHRPVKRAPKGGFLFRDFFFRTFE